MLRFALMLLWEDGVGTAFRHSVRVKPTVSYTCRTHPYRPPTGQIVQTHTCPKPYTVVCWTATAARRNELSSAILVESRFRLSVTRNLRAIFDSRSVLPHQHIQRLTRTRHAVETYRVRMKPDPTLWLSEKTYSTLNPSGGCHLGWIFVSGCPAVSVRASHHANWTHGNTHL